MPAVIAPYWYAPVAYEALVQLTRLQEGLPYQPPRRHASGAILEYVAVPSWALAELGLTVTEDGRRVRKSMSAVVRCPGCGRNARYLSPAADRRWGCYQCNPLQAELGWDIGQRVMSYACALRMFLEGRALRRYYIRLYRAVALKLPDIRDPMDVTMLPLAALLLQLPIYSPVQRSWWYRRPRWWGQGRMQPGPVAKLLRPHLLSAMIDSVLHPDAFHVRYVQGVPPTAWVRRPPPRKIPVHPPAR